MSMFTNHISTNDIKTFTLAEEKNGHNFLFDFPLNFGSLTYMYIVIYTYYSDMSV